MFILLCLFSFPYVIKTLFSCPINIGQGYHYPRASIVSGYFLIRVNRFNITIYENETIAIKASSLDCDNSTEILSNDFRAIYGTNRVVIIVDNDNIPHKFSVFNHDNPRVSVFFIGH